jgi:DNA primase
MLPIPLDAKVLKRHVDIVDVAGRYTRLRRRGRQHVGLCPLHSERHPSFYVDPAKGVFYCFGCGVGGDVFALVMRAEGVDFRTALAVVSGVASESEGRVAKATQGPKRYRAGEGAAPQPAKRAGHIARLKPEPKPRAVGKLPPLAVDCAAERHLETGR